VAGEAARETTRQARSSASVLNPRALGDPPQSRAAPAAVRVPGATLPEGRAPPRLVPPRWAVDPAPPVGGQQPAKLPPQAAPARSLFWFFAHFFLPLGARQIYARGFFSGGGRDVAHAAAISQTCRGQSPRTRTVHLACLGAGETLGARPIAAATPHRVRSLGATRVWPRGRQPSAPRGAAPTQAGRGSVAACLVTAEILSINFRCLYKTFAAKVACAT
jgi:hypothetical protein